MAYEFIPIVDGDSLNAVGLETRFTAIESEINALNQEAVLPRSLDNQHVASQVLFSRTKSIPAGGGTHLYSNRDPGASATVTEDTSLGPTGWYIIRAGGQTGSGGGTGDKLELYFGTAGSFTVGDEGTKQLEQLQVLGRLKNCAKQLEKFNENMHDKLEDFSDAVGDLE